MLQQFFQPFAEDARADSQLVGGNASAAALFDQQERFLFAVAVGICGKKLAIFLLVPFQSAFSLFGSVVDNDTAANGRNR